MVPDQFSASRRYLDRLLLERSRVRVTLSRFPHHETIVFVTSSIARLVQRLLVQRDRNPFGNFICARNKLDVIKRGEISALSSKVEP